MSQSKEERLHNRGEADRKVGKSYNPPHSVLSELVSNEAGRDNTAYRKGWDNHKNQKEGKK